MEKGDYIYDPNTGVSFIFNDWIDDSQCNLFCILGSDGSLGIDCSGFANPNGYKNLPETIDELDKALFKEGYYFDTDKLEMSEKRWMPEIGDRYYMPFSNEKTWVGDYIDLRWYEQGLICKTDQEADILMEVSHEAIRKYLTNKK